MEIKEVMENLKSHLSETTNEIKELVAKQDLELKQYGETTEKTGAQIKEATKRIDDIQAELKSAQSRLDEFEKANGRLFGGDNSVKSLGQAFVQSQEFKNYNPSSQGRSEAVGVKSFFQKTLTGAPLGNVPGYLYQPGRVPGILAPAERVERVRDLMNVIPTSQGAIEFVRETGFINEADAVPEFVAGSEGNKPRSGLSFSLESASMKTVAHWLPVTRQILADAQGLQGYIDSRLVYGLKIAEDQQLLYGDGLNQNLQGIMTCPGVQQYNWSQGVVGDSKLDAIRRAMTLARLAEYPVTGLVLNPSDWEDIELLKGDDGHYIWINVNSGGQQVLFKVPVIESSAIMQGDFLTGAFAMAATLWDREDASIQISDSHEDFFTKNLIAIRAEERLCTTIYRPEAFVVGNFDNTPV